jgi:uncharacterized RDD family membrane protein YckC
MQDNAIAFTPAPFLIRIAAMVYELLLVTAVVFVASFIIIPVVGEMHQSWQRHLFQVYLLGVLFAYFSAFWLRSGQTLAMKTWRIRLVQENGDTLTFKQAVLRFVLAGFFPALALIGYWWTHTIIFFWIFFAGLSFLWALIDRDRQFLHDRIAGTRLVRVPRKA